MSQTTEQIEVTWASDDRTLLAVALAALPTVGVAHTPIVSVTWNGTTAYAARVSSTIGAIARPNGIREEAAPVAGVFMQGPAKPTPLEWMDRLPAARQEDLLEALDVNKRGRRFKARLLAAREIDPANPETIAGVTMLQNAGVLTSEEATTLLA